MLQSQERARETAEDVQGADVEAHEERSKTRMEMRGSVPEVEQGDQAIERPSASDMAFGDGGGKLGGNWLTDAASDLLGGDDKQAEPAQGEALPDTRNFLGGLFGGDDKKQGPPPVITSAALFPASKGPERKRIGVGELVDLNSNVAGKWTMNGQPLFGSSMSFFKAPSVAGKVTIGFEATDGQKTSMNFDVVAPSKINYRKDHESNSIDWGTAGAGMVLNMDLDPDDVSFASVGVQELPHQATSQSGYFSQIGKKPFQANHEPNPNWTPVGLNNTLMGTDHAFMKDMPAPWQKGEVVWDIPHNYLVHGDTVKDKQDKNFGRPIRQVLRVLDDQGTCQVEKDGQLTKARKVTDE